MWFRLRVNQDEDLREFLVDEAKRTRHGISTILRDLLEEARIARTRSVS